MGKSENVVSVKESKKDKKQRKLEKKSKKVKKNDDLDTKSESEAESEDEESGESGDESARATLEEIEIDLSAGVPLSKKQKRLLKKGKLDLVKLAKKNPAPKPELSPEDQEKADEEAKKSKKSEFGVWIGNLSFDTTREDLIRFIVGKTAQYPTPEESSEDDGLVKIEEEDISRVNIPKKENKIKGFAYVDFPTLKHVLTVVALSESQLNGRKLLIKNANSFEGRPEKDASAPLSKNPPSRILFVGNLSFDTSQDNLEEHFRHCGEIVKIRMATFEDSGKCKGFAFIDFKDEQGPTTALKSKLTKKMINRPLRLEFGEDRSKRNPHQRKREVGEDGEERPFNISGDRSERFDRSERPERSERFERPERSERFERPERTERFERPERTERFERSETSAPKHSKPFQKRPFRENDQASNKRLKSSVALATAQRASAAIVPSSGKKIKFD